MDLLIIAGVVGLLVLCIVVSGSDVVDGIFSGLVGGAITLAVLGVFWLMTYPYTIGENAQLEAFYNETIEAYEVLVEDAQELVIQVPGPRLTDFAQQRQAEAAIEAQKELRDKVEWYNRTLRTNGAFEEMFFFRAYLQGTPDYLKPITIA